MSVKMYKEKFMLNIMLDWKCYFKLKTEVLLWPSVCML